MAQEDLASTLKIELVVHTLQRRVSREATLELQPPDEWRIDDLGRRCGCRDTLYFGRSGQQLGHAVILSLSWVSFSSCVLRCERQVVTQLTTSTVDP